MDILLAKNKIITKFLCFLITALPFYNFVSGQSPNPTLTAKDLQPNYGWAWVDEFPWIYSASTSSWFYIYASDTVSSFDYTSGSYLPFFSDTTKPSGWYWFSENFPFIYSHQTSSWTYLTGIDEGLLFYNSNHKAWRTFSNSLANYYDPALKPFYHGVASGDPLQDAVIIWTRYTPDDEESGPFDISWTMATDNEMNAVVASGNASSKQENDFTVKVDVTGLSANTTYYYQFTSGSTKSVIGKTKTAPSSGAETIRLGLASCANFPVGYFTAYRDMALRGDLDAVLNLGDYIYEYGDNDDLRPHIPSNEIVELDDYRARYSQYRLDPDLRLAHQHIPFISIWDDHEFANDSHKTGADNHDPSTEGSWDDRVIAAKKCYDEWMPIRPNVSSGNLYQKLPFGDLLDIFMTETNTYRDGPNNNDPVTGDYLVTATGQLYSVLYGSPQHLSPTRTQLGITQRDWLIGSLAASSAKWKIVGSSKVFSEMNEWFAASQFGDTPQNTESRTTDGWDGYPVERSTIIQSLQSLGVQGIAFVAGDAHITTSNEVVDQADTLALLSGAGSGSLINYIATGEGSVAVEFATTSVTSHNFDEGLLPFTNGSVEAAMGLAKQLESAFTTPIPLAALASLGVQPELFSSILPDGTITPNYHIKYANLTDEGYSVLTINPDEIQRDNYYVLNKSDHDAPLYWGGGTKTVFGTNKLSTAMSEASPVNRVTFTSDPLSYIQPVVPTQDNSGGSYGGDTTAEEDSASPVTTTILANDFESGDASPLSIVSVTSNADWEIGTFEGNSYLRANGYGADVASDDWVITPPLQISGDEVLTFRNAKNYDGGSFTVLVSNDYNGDGNPTNATWTVLSPELSDGGYQYVNSGELSLSAHIGKAYIAFRYISTGTGGGDGADWQFDDLLITGSGSVMVEAKTYLSQNFETGSMLPLKEISVSSNANWEVLTYNDNQYIQANGYGADTASDDWAITPPLELGSNDILKFKTAKNYDGGSFSVLVSNDYDGQSDPTSATWTALDPLLSEGGYNYVESGELSLAAFAGNAYIAFRYTSTGTGGGDGASWQVDDIEISGTGKVLAQFEASVMASPDFITDSTPVTLIGSAANGIQPFSYSWDLGDGNKKTGESVSHTYASGSYKAKLTATDSTGQTATKEYEVVVEKSVDIPVPSQTGDLRVASFNAYLNRPSEGKLLEELKAGENQQIKNVAEIIQRVNPDVIAIQEFDYSGEEAVELFKTNFLEVSQNGQPIVTYPYHYVNGVNTGVPSGLDFNNDGKNDGPDDGYGYGSFPGQYGMVVLSKHPIDTPNVRTFQNFLWKDMPNNYLPTNKDGSDYYSAEATAVFRLSSKSHWDLPIIVNGKTVHILNTHPTPPVFDGDEDRNGKRNHDEIRMFADYVANTADYLYDDNGVTGGLPVNTRFVINGDLNADPDEGDSFNNAIMQVLNNKAVNSSAIPLSVGGPMDGEDDDDTANWGMRADYVLPSIFGLEIEQSGVFWPAKNDRKYFLVDQTSGSENSSDHRLVWVDLTLTDSVSQKAPYGSVGSTTALIPVAGTADDPSEYLLDGRSGDTDFPFADFKALATVGESDSNTGTALTGYPDGHAAWLLDNDTIRVAYQSESYATMGKFGETYGWTMNNGVTFTGSHIHTIDYDRSKFAAFLDNGEAASSMYESSGHLFHTVYNQFGEEVLPRAEGGKWGNQTKPDGTIIEFSDDFKLSEGEFFFQSFCGAFYEKANKYGDGIGFADDTWLCSEEWNIGSMFPNGYADSAETMGLASVVVDIANEVAYTAPALGQTGYEKLMPINPGHQDYVVVVCAGYNHGQEPAPLKLYVGMKGKDVNGNPVSATANARDQFLARNGLLYGKIYGLALKNSDFAALNITEVDPSTKMMDAYLKDASAPDTFSAKFAPTSFKWAGFDQPVAVKDTEMMLWEKESEQPSDHTFFNGDSKTEHPAVDPDITKFRYVQNMTQEGAILGFDFGNLTTQLTAANGDLPGVLEVSVRRIVAAVDGALALKVGGKGVGHYDAEGNPDGKTAAIHIEKDTAKTVAPDGLMWVKTADYDMLIVDEDSGNDFGERKFALPLKSDTLELTEPNLGYFLAMAGGKHSPRGKNGVASIRGANSGATSSEFSGSWNVTALVSKKSDGSFYSKSELDGTKEQQINQMSSLADSTMIGVVQHRTESGGLVKHSKSDAGGQLFMFRMKNIPLK